MKRLTKEAWFGKKFVLGLKPITWQGWIVTGIFALSLMLDIYIFRRSLIEFLVVIILIACFTFTALLTGGEFGSALLDNLRKNKKKSN